MERSNGFWKYGANGSFSPRIHSYVIFHGEGRVNMISAIWAIKILKKMGNHVITYESEKISYERPIDKLSSIRFSLFPFIPVWLNGNIWFLPSQLKWLYPNVINCIFCSKTCIIWVSLKIPTCLQVKFTLKSYTVAISHCMSVRIWSRGNGCEWTNSFIYIFEGL